MLRIKGKDKSSNDAAVEQEQTRLEKRIVEQTLKSDVDDTERSLRERIKELNCLYGLSRLEEIHDTDLEAILQGLVELIPSSWQYSELTAARIIFDGKTYQTANFEETRWRQSADIHRGDTPAGLLEVCYLEETGLEDEGPFLKEERALIDALAEHLRRISERHEYSQQLHRALRQLQLERDALAETNAALRVVMSRFEEEKRATSQELAGNIERVVMPILQTLYSEIPHNLTGYLDLLKKSLREVSSPFVSRLTKQYSALSPTEIIICNMIRNGLTSKEIADLRHISPVTVARHREHIRKKLGISNTNTNLTTYLQRIEIDES
jgi:DNA-binding CsgD family transcriptional regulator